MTLYELISILFQLISIYLSNLKLWNFRKFGLASNLFGRKKWQVSRGIQKEFSHTQDYIFIKCCPILYSTSFTNQIFYLSKNLVFIHLILFFKKLILKHSTLFPRHLWKKPYILQWFLEILTSWAFPIDFEARTNDILGDFLELSCVRTFIRSLPAQKYHN